MTPSRIALLLHCLVLTSACASGSGSETSRGSGPAGVLALEEVAPRPLPDGRCSLILYSREPSPKRILVAFDTPAQAIIRTGGREYTLQRRQTSGDVRFGHASAAEYGGSAGLSVTVAVTFDASPSRDGAPVRDATITATQGAGDAVVTPAVGVVACTPGAPD